MYANTSLLKKIISDPTLAYPIQPWKTVKSEISTNLMNSKSLFASENANVHLDDSGLQSGNGSNSSNNSTAISMTIPHGFQLIRSLEHSKPTLKSVIYVPPTTTTELFVSLDTHNLHVWRGSNRIRKINTAGIQTVKINDLPISKGGTGQAGVFGINRWKYVDSLKIFVVASTQLQLRVLDSHFDELSNVLTPKPVLCLEIVDTKQFVDVLTGEVGGIRIWRIKTETIQNRDYQIFVQSRFINDLSSDDWVSFIHFEKSTGRIFAAFEANIYIYEYSTGERLDTLHNLHDMSITCLCYYESSQFLITAGKDAKVKVWNSQNRLVYEFGEHLSPITGLILVETCCEAVFRTVPAVMSCSLDGTIRMWNFETGLCTYRHDTQQQCLGMAAIKKDTFYHYSKQAVYVWNLNRHLLTMTFLRARPLILKTLSYPILYEDASKKTSDSRFKVPPSRLFVYSSDNALRMISPVSGIPLITSLPVKSDEPVLDFFYEPEHNLSYTFNIYGDIVVQDWKTNPAKVVDLYKNSGTFGNLTSVCAIDIHQYKNSLSTPKMFSARMGNVLTSSSMVACAAVIFARGIEKDLSSKTRKIASIGFLNLSKLKQDPVRVLGRLLGRGSNTAPSSASSRRSRKNTTARNFSEDENVTEMRLQNFYLMAGTDTGQIVCVHVRRNGKQEAIMQAHTGGITILKFDSLNFSLISGAKDYCIKIWKIHIEGADLTSNQENSLIDADLNITFDSNQCPISLECFRVIETHALGIPKVIGLNNEKEVIAIPAKGAIVLVSYRKEEQPVYPAFADEHPGEVTEITFSNYLGIWASSNTDGTVKIWDADNILIREIQFNEPIFCLTFANIRGDLLVGLKDQIGLVRIQDYLPNFILRAVVTSAFSDDPIETPLKFDSTVDFWEYYYDDSETFWHIPKKEFAEAKKVSENSNIQIRRTPHRPNEQLTKKRRKKRVYLEKERMIYNESKKYEEAYETDEEEESGSDMEYYDTSNVVKTEELYDFDPAELQPGSPTELVIEHEHKVIAEEPKLKIVSKVKKQEEPEETPPRDPMWEELLRPPPKPKLFDKQWIQRKRSSIRRQLQAQGVIMPNSSAISEFSDEKSVLKLYTKPTLPNRKSIDPPSKYIIPLSRARGNKVDVVKANKNDGKKQHHFNIKALLEDIPGDDAESAKSTPRDSLKLPQVLVQDEPTKPTQSKEVDMAIQKQPEPESVVIPLIIATEELTKIANVVTVEPAEEKISQTPPKQFESEQPKFERELKESKPERTPFFSATVSTKKKVAPAKKTVTEFVPVTQKLVKLPSNIPSTIFQKENIPVPNKTSPTDTSLPIEIINNIVPVPVAVGSKDTYNVVRTQSKSRSRFPSVLEKSSKPEPEMTEESNAKFDILITEDPLKRINSEIPIEFKKIMSSFWFPGFNDRSITLENLIGILIDVMRGGLWSEKCEASKALLYLFHCFRGDFRDPVGTLIIPQLDSKDDPDWQVRAQLCVNLAGYDVKHESVFIALFYILSKDEVKKVRKAAINTLHHFGIMCKEHLKSIMEDLGLMQNRKQNQLKGTFLDEQVVELKLQHEVDILSSEEVVREWLQKLEKNAYQGLRRIPSFENHLAGKYFPPDCQGFTMPLPSINVLAAHPMGAMEAYKRELRYQKEHTEGSIFAGTEKLRPVTAESKEAHNRTHSNNHLITDLDGWDVLSTKSFEAHEIRKPPPTSKPYRPGGSASTRGVVKSAFSSYTRDKYETLQNVSLYDDDPSTWIKSMLNSSQLTTHDRHKTLVNEEKTAQFTSYATILALNRRPITAGALNTLGTSERIKMLSPVEMKRRTLSTPKSGRAKSAISKIFAEQKPRHVPTALDTWREKHDKAWR